MINLQGKKAGVLLVYPDFTDEKVKEETGGSYSEGLASISAVLKQNGHNVNLLHLLYEHDEEKYKKKLSAISQNVDLIGFSTRTTAFLFVKEMIRWTKEVLPGVFVFCGSYHPTLVPDEVLACDGCDAVCIGEGEFPLLELCDKMTAGENYYDVQSFYFKKENGEFVKNEIRPLIEDLDILPIPDFDLFDYKNLYSTKVKTSIVMMSRGCLFACTYCGNSQFRNVYPNKKKYCRFRSPENALKYLQTLLQKYPDIEFLNFRDAIFNMYHEWFDEFIELYKKHINRRFTCNLRFDTLTEDTVRRLHEAGCYLIDLGVESGDEELRKKYLKRNMTNEQMINVCKWFRKYGITCLTYNIVGLPHEDLHKTLKTIKLNVELNPNKIIANIFYPYPMTVLHDIAKEAGFVPDVIPVNCRVPLKQEKYPEHHVLFAATYFMKYIKRYKFCRKMPVIIGKPLEAFWDFSFTGPLTPRRFLIAKHDFLYKIKEKFKRSFLKYAPKTYNKLKKSRLGK